MGFDINPAMTGDRLLHMTLPPSAPGGGLAPLHARSVSTDARGFGYEPTDGTATESHFRALVAQIYGRDGAPLTKEQIDEAMRDPTLAIAHRHYLRGDVAIFPRHLEPVAMSRPPTISGPVSAAPAIDTPAVSPRPAVPVERPTEAHAVATPSTRVGPGDLTFPPTSIARFTHVMEAYHSTRTELLNHVAELRRTGQGELANREVYLIDMLDRHAATFAHDGPGSDAPDMTGAGELSQVLYASMCALGYAPADATRESGFSPPLTRDSAFPAGPTAASPWNFERDLPTERNPMFFWTTPF